MLQCVHVCVCAAVCAIQELYVLMRIHHVLCDRLGKAVKLADDAKALKAGQVQYT